MKHGANHICHCLPGVCTLLHAIVRCCLECKEHKIFTALGSMYNNDGVLESSCSCYTSVCFHRVDVCSYKDDSKQCTLQLLQLLNLPTLTYQQVVLFNVICCSHTWRRATWALLYGEDWSPHGRLERLQVQGCIHGEGCPLSYILHVSGFPG